MNHNESICIMIAFSDNPWSFSDQSGFRFATLWRDTTTGSFPKGQGTQKIKFLLMSTRVTTPKNNPDWGPSEFRCVCWKVCNQPIFLCLPQIREMKSGNQLWYLEIAALKILITSQTYSITVSCTCWGQDGYKSSLAQFAERKSPASLS